ncbi:hypothetical protein OHB26_07785 [Nocardia sp. NBC_01503]|uniref:hypothetical protein n=1 Tax=Nocardia sp. NBC_01503 TaxID=2975997 RepID=UPI002E7B61C9|nr:hypothetical protein [Nocardia sp. NBC_01503]WTL34104.1 hypothetical protein OHB26_07785 [Nocardia sp. NBC_01503]
MRRTARLVMIGAVAAAALTTGAAAASADTGSANPGSIGTLSANTGSSPGLGLSLLTAGSSGTGSSIGGNSLPYLIEQLLINSGSFTRCQLVTTDDPSCFFPVPH